MRGRAVFYLDSSALVKRYLPEPGTRWVRHISATASIAMAEFSIVEVASALARRVRMGDLDPRLCDDLLEAFLQDVEGYSVLSPNRGTVLLAVELTRRHPLRAYDALQLATALQLADALRSESFSLTFVSADERLCAAAEQEGLPTVNPNSVANAG
ncbi:MAG: type II toxin-antitoxin system VapC family toxin [Thermoflexales bacterium]|nr:type II toxin-antitoxin system VapC family toxin [Thermoflexales bacterium]